MKYKRAFIGGVLIALLVFAGLTVWQRKKTSLQGLGFQIAGMDDFSVTEKFKPYFSEYTEETIIAQGKLGILHVTLLSNIEKGPAEKYISSQFVLFDGMFDAKLPPYPEFLTSATGCAEEFLPKQKEALAGRYYTIYADERFNYGICDQQLAQYKSGVGIFYCAKEQETVKISYYIDKSEGFDKIDALMNSFTCTDN